MGAAQGGRRLYLPPQITPDLPSLGRYLSTTRFLATATRTAPACALTSLPSCCEPHNPASSYHCRCSCYCRCYLPPPTACRRDTGVLDGRLTTPADMDIAFTRAVGRAGTGSRMSFDDFVVALTDLATRRAAAAAAATGAPSEQEPLRVMLQDHILPVYDRLRHDPVFVVDVAQVRGRQRGGAGGIGSGRERSRCGVQGHPLPTPPPPSPAPPPSLSYPAGRRGRVQVRLCRGVLAAGRDRVPQ